MGNGARVASSSFVLALLLSCSCSSLALTCGHLSVAGGRTTRLPGNRAYQGVRSSASAESTDLRRLMIELDRRVHFRIPSRRQGLPGPVASPHPAAAGHPHAAKDRHPQPWPGPRHGPWRMARGALQWTTCTLLTSSQSLSTKPNMGATSLRGVYTNEKEGKERKTL